MNNILQLQYQVENGIKAVSNLFIIQQSIKKYGVTPQLEHLIGNSFSGASITLSEEGVMGSIKSGVAGVIRKIVSIFKAIIRKIRAGLRTVKNFIFRSKRKIKDAASKIPNRDTSITFSISPLMKEMALDEEFHDIVKIHETMNLISKGDFSNEEFSAIVEKMEPVLSGLYEKYSAPEPEWIHVTATINEWLENVSATYRRLESIAEQKTRIDTLSNEYIRYIAQINNILIRDNTSEDAEKFKVKAEGFLKISKIFSNAQFVLDHMDSGARDFAENVASELNNLVYESTESYSFNI